MPRGADACPPRRVLDNLDCPVCKGLLEVRSRIRLLQKGPDLLRVDVHARTFENRATAIMCEALFVGIVHLGRRDGREDRSRLFLGFFTRLLLRLIHQLRYDISTSFQALRCTVNVDSRCLDSVWTLPKQDIALISNFTVAVG